MNHPEPIINDDKTKDEELKNKTEHGQFLFILLNAECS